jgi:hypothetical protein
LRLLNRLMSYLNGYERCLKRSRLSPATNYDPAEYGPPPVSRTDTG